MEQSTQLLAELRSMYEEIGEPIEPDFTNPEDFLTDFKVATIHQRMNDLIDTKVR
jgi:hypothetical protein